MIKTIKNKATADTPEILFDKEKNIFQITGRSLPENAHDFYKPFVEWMKDYAKEPNDSSVFEINLDYFNSSSIKQLLMLFMAFESIKNIAGKKVKILWVYNEDDDLNKIKGREFESMLSIEFEFKEIV